MKFLLDIPLVMAVATWVWGGGSGGDEDKDDVSWSSSLSEEQQQREETTPQMTRIVSPEICVEAFPFMHAACWKQLVAKGLGVAIILGACLNKAPVMMNIWNAKSCAGLSKASVYTETIVYANQFFYGYLQSYPVTAYGETGAVMIQNFIIISFMWHYSDDPAVSTRERSAVIGAAVIYAAVVLVLLPATMQYLLMATVWPLFMYSRGSQIVDIYRIQHTGTNSIVTTAMNLAGSGVRILTTIQEVGWDMNVLFGYALGVILNMTMFLQYFYYRENTIKAMADLKVQKERKKKE